MVIGRQVLRGLTREVQLPAMLRRHVHIDVKIVEVGPRDGLQNESVIVSTKDKLTLIEKLEQSSCPVIEVASFVSPKWVPTMADSGGVMETLNIRRQHKKDGCSALYSCLVPNLKGYVRARDAGSDMVAIFASASEAFSQKNINCSIEESMTRFAQVADAAKQDDIPMRGYVSCVLGCPYDGHVPPANVARVSERLLELGCEEISLGDTIGIGTPGPTVEMLAEVQTVVDTQKIAVHFHDTYAQALVNIFAALERGVRIVDSSVGGLGGCPYAKGASGNVATEDVVYMLQGMGLETGIDLEKLIEAGSFIHDVLGRETRSKVAMAMKSNAQQS